MSSIVRGAVLAVAVSVALSGEHSWSQTTGPIKVVVPVPPGGSLDIVVRLLADQIARTQGPVMVIENHPGAGTAIATEAVSRATPDGSTLLVNTPPFLINSHLRKLPYDPLTSFVPICYLTRSPAVIVVNSTSPYRTLADLVNAARARPGELTLASTGPATVSQIAFEKLKRAADINMTFVPYPGMVPAVNALLGNHVTAVFGNYGDVIEPVNSGRLRALAAATRTRIESSPDLPTIAESGYRDNEADVWYGLVAPANTPKVTTSKFAGWVAGAIQAPEFRSRLTPLRIYPVGTCGADFGDFLRKQYDEYGQAIREANIKAE
jgi:tripartite-type tricarboxylate transporter receptor subunit TctC